MRKKLLFAGSAIAVVGLAVGLVSMAEASPDITQARTIRVVTQTAQSRFLNLDGHRFGQGDEFLFHDVVQNTSGHRIGTDGGVCTITFSRRPGAAQCLVTMRFPEGQITFQGLLRGPELSPGGTATIPVTGGSGIYQNVRGEATVKTISNTVSDITIHLIP